MTNMTKGLIIGLATVAISGATLLGTGMYAATANTISNTVSFTQHMRSGMGGPEDMINSLSGKVSVEALTALQTLTAKHKTEMDAQRSSSTTVDEATMKAKHEAFKTEMESLMTKYPELKTAMEANRPTGDMGGRGGKMGGRGGYDNSQIDTVIATLPTAAQAELKNIHESYQTKEQALRTEEKTKIDAVLAKYPEVKAKLDALRPVDGPGRGPMGQAPTSTAAK